ncbi:MAG: hypothetical protein H7196_03280 [candidate division SR1 bacterium]|nr:hypothetical protein [candidate division SR1 bacterium]
MQYSYDQYIQMRDTLKNLANATYNQPFVLARNSKGERIGYIARWEFISELLAMIWIGWLTT